MTAPMSMPTESITMQLADPWTLADYTDITPLIKQWSGLVRGRQHELQLFQAGQVALTMYSNEGGRFNPWNTNGPFYNLLTPGDASCETTDGTANTSPAVSNWLTGSTKVGCAVVQAIPPVIIDGPVAYKLTATTTAASITMADNVYAVTAGNYYSIMCSFLAGSTSRSCQINALWYTSGGSLISTSSVAVSDNSSTWTKASLLGIKAPATAAFVALQVDIPTTVNTEIHWYSRVALFNYTSQVPNTAWAPGQRGLVPGRPIQCTATWNSVTYQVWSMYISNFTPKYGQVKSEQVINACDGMALLALGDVSSSAYANQVLADGAQNFWRLGDPMNAWVAADSGPLNQQLTASFVQFGQASPILTDDTTTALMGSSNTQPGSLSAISTVPAGAQSMEFDFMAPTANNEQIIYYNATTGAAIAFSGGSLAISAGSSGSGSLATIGATLPSLDNGTWHHMVITSSAATNGTLTAYVDGLSVGSGTATGGGGSDMIAPSTSFTFGSVIISGIGYPLIASLANIAFYNVALTSTQVANHYALFSAGFAVQYSGQRIQEILTVIGWPSSLQNIATGISQVQGATSSLTQTAALSYIQTVEQTEMGAFFCDPSGIATYYDRHYVITASAATISNGTFADDNNSSHFHYLPGLIPAMDDTDLWNDVPAQRNGGVLQRSSSILSIKQYTKRTLTGYTGELQTTDAEVLAQTQWLLQHYEIPYTRCRSISLSSRTDAGKNLPQMLGRGIFDLITLIWTPLDGSTIAFNQASLIESIQHTVTQEEWITTWGLSPAEAQSYYMILNDAVRGQLSTNNRLGY